MTEAYGFMFILKLLYNKEKYCNKIETFEGFFHVMPDALV